jgi:hypothetical protein
LSTGIDDINAFLQGCPTNDPAYAQIMSDFTIRIDGVPVEEIACTEPYPEMPLEELDQALITLQVLRTIYYMDPQVSGHLPWTSMSLYDWMAANIGGFNHVTQPGYLYCCQEFDGEKYVVQSIQDDYNRDHKRDWPGIASTLAFFAHEVRHADGGPAHVAGCEAYPDPDGARGCDPDYDLNNLGSYGIQYWLNEAWMKGYLNVGIACDAATAYDYVDLHRRRTNDFRRRIVADVPPELPLPDPPYGGPCPAP